MKRKSSRMKKILAFVVMVAVLFTSLPIYAFATFINADNNDIISEEITDEVVVLEEDISLREENTKQFILSDGTKKAVSYSQPVHYKDENGEWIDINNALTLSSNEYETNNKSQIKFANKSGSTGLLSIKDGEYKIDFTPLNANKVSVEIENPQSNNSRKFDDVKLLTNLISRATYKDIYDGIDLEYILTGNNIKENIIVNTKQEGYVYTFELKLNKLSAELEDNSIILSDYDTGEQIYVIPAPYMYDANGEISTGVEYSLTQNNKWKYTFIVSANEEWINSEERAFPVTIDPTVVVNAGRTDTFVYDDGDYSDMEIMKVGNFAGQDDVVSFIKFDTLPTIPRGSVLSKAEMATYSSNVLIDPNVNFSVGVYRAKDDWITKTLTFSNRNDFYDSTFCYDVVPVIKTGVYEWDITDLYEKWINNTVENYGVCLKAINLPSGVSANLHIDTLGINASGESIQYYVTPQLEVTYFDIVGVEDYYAYATNSLGDYGNSYINAYNGALTYVNRLTSVTTQSFTYDINMVYNSIDNSWEPSFQESITMIDYNIYNNYPENDKRDDVYVWKDADGTSHAFTIYMEKKLLGRHSCLSS